MNVGRRHHGRDKFRRLRPKHAQTPARLAARAERGTKPVVGAAQDQQVCARAYGQEGGGRAIDAAKSLSPPDRRATGAADGRASARRASREGRDWNEG